jgi:hypothetical protein
MGWVRRRPDSSESYKATRVVTWSSYCNYFQFLGLFGPRGRGGKSNCDHRFESHARAVIWSRRKPATHPRAEKKGSAGGNAVRRPSRDWNTSSYVHGTLSAICLSAASISLYFGFRLGGFFPSRFFLGSSASLVLSPRDIETEPDVGIRSAVELLGLKILLMSAVFPNAAFCPGGFRKQLDTTLLFSAPE